MKSTVSPLINTTRTVIRTLSGMSYVELGSIYIGLILCCGYVYFLLAQYFPGHGPSIGEGSVWVQLFNSIYFSAITATSIGYGDILPHGISKLIASFQGMFSLFIFAILVSKPISERQNAALYQMHKLTLDEIFTSVREGFYIMRRDFDAVIHELQETSACSVHAENNLQTALYQGQVLMEDVPTFYDTEQKLYVLDRRRETLLAEAVERTCGRLANVFDAAKEKKIRLSERTTVSAEEFKKTAKAVMGLWKKRATNSVHQHIDQAMALLDRV